MLKFFRGLSIRTKLLTMMLGVSLVSILIVGRLGYSTGSTSLTRQSFDQLSSVRATKAYQIESSIREIQNEVGAVIEATAVPTAVREFREAFAALESAPIPAKWDTLLTAYYENDFLPKLGNNLDSPPALDDYLPQGAAARYLQYHYLAANPFPLGEKENLDDAGDGSSYSEVHARYHRIFRTLVDRFGYYDLFLIDPDSGAIVYSVYKETDYATSLFDGPYRESNLSQGARRASLTREVGRVITVDFASYDPSYAAPAAFFASPILEEGQLLGILAVQIPVSELNRIMTGGQDWERDGLGKSGETYLVGPDFLMRSISRFLIEDREGYLSSLREIGIDEAQVRRIDRLDTTILQQEVRTEAAIAALDGQSGTEIVDDYRGVPVLSSYAPLNLEDLDWAILSEIDAAEATAPIRSLERKLGIWTAVIAICIVLLALSLSRQFIQPILALMEASREMGSGRWDVKVQLYSNDEIGELATSFNDMASGLKKRADIIVAKSRENRKLMSFIRDTFGRYVSEDVAEALLASEGEVTLGGEERDVTVLLSDIESYSTLSEGLPPSQVLEVLNAYLGAMNKVTDNHSGVVIEYLGDAILAVFGAPQDLADHPAHAVRCAIEMRDRLADLNAEWEESGLAKVWQEQGVERLVCRIGLHSGRVVAGNIGSETRMKYAITGDTVNVAARLESANKDLGTNILASGEVYDRLPESLRLKATSHGSHPVKGRAQEVAFYSF